MVRRGVACDECTENCQTLHQNQENPSPIITRFLKIMYGTDFSKFLYLPIHFARKVKNLDGKETRIKDSNGKTWLVKLSYVDDKLSFTKGWDKFYQEHGLHDGQFLIIQYMKGSHFVVQIYNKCGCEETKFNTRRSRSQQSKKSNKRDPKLVSKDELFQTPNLNSGIKPTPSINVEDTCMINRNDECLQEGRNLDLYDLEQGKETTDANGISKALDTKIVANAEIIEKALDTNIIPCCTETTDQAKTTGRDAQMAVISENQMNGNSGDVFSAEFEALETNVVPAHSDIDEQSKTAMNNTNQINDNSADILIDKFENEQSEIAMMDTNQMNCNSGDIFTENFEEVLKKDVVSARADIDEKSKIKGNDPKKAAVDANKVNDKSEKPCEMKAVSSCTETMEQNKTMADDAQMTVNQITGYGRDAYTEKFHIETSDNCKMSKGISKDVPKFQNDGETPSIGSSKIAERENAAKRKFCKSSVSSSVLKDPFGIRSIKRERVELGEDVKIFPTVSRGKEPIMIKKVVKVEPDLSSDDALSSFSAEVKTQSYLELPIPIPLIPGRKERGQGKVVYLRNSNGRLWPVLYPDKYSVKAFTANWKNFCKQNNIKPGDKCRFQAVRKSMCIYRVDVTRKSGGFRGK